MADNQLCLGVVDKQALMGVADIDLKLYFEPICLSRNIRGDLKGLQRCFSAEKYCTTLLATAGISLQA